MRPSELAALTGVSTRVLRHYEAKGLIVSQRLDNGYRNYDAKEVEKVRWITSLLKCGFSTRQIAELEKFSQVSDMDDARFIQCLAQHRENFGHWTRLSNYLMNAEIHLPRVFTPTSDRSV